jgi:hypothetical protein
MKNLAIERYAIRINTITIVENIESQLTLYQKNILLSTKSHDGMGNRNTNSFGGRLLPKAEEMAAATFSPMVFRVAVPLAFSPTCLMRCRVTRGIAHCGRSTWSPGKRVLPHESYVLWKR